jgi:hypothetical protein
MVLRSKNLRGSDNNYTDHKNLKIHHTISDPEDLYRKPNLITNLYQKL